MESDERWVRSEEAGAGWDGWWYGVDVGGLREEGIMAAERGSSSHSGFVSTRCDSRVPHPPETSPTRSSRQSTELASPSPHTTTNPTQKDSQQLKGPWPSPSSHPRNPASSAPRRQPSLAAPTARLTLPIGRRRCDRQPCGHAKITNLHGGGGSGEINPSPRSTSSIRCAGLVCPLNPVPSLLSLCFCYPVWRGGNLFPLV